MELASAPDLYTNYGASPHWHRTRCCISSCSLYACDIWLKRSIRNTNTIFYPAASLRDDVCEQVELSTNKYEIEPSCAPASHSVIANTSTVASHIVLYVTSATR
jgi:hypothetical protein